MQAIFKYNKWDKVFKNGPSKICGRQPMKNLKGYGPLSRRCIFGKTTRGCVKLTPSVFLGLIGWMAAIGGGL